MRARCTCASRTRRGSCRAGAPRPIWTPTRSSRRQRPRVATRSIRATASWPSGPISREAAPTPDLTFVGPAVAHLELFGDKARARKAALVADVPVIRGLDHAVSLEEARAFFAVPARRRDDHQGRRRRRRPRHAGGAIARTRSSPPISAAGPRPRRRSAAADVYVEEFIPRARHIEVQILGDLSGGIAHLGERECSVQRRFQKIIEIAPAPGVGR